MVGVRLYLLGALVLGTLSTLWGSSPAIGTATANGAFAVNKAQVSGTATLFDGAVVETGVAASKVTLNNGSRIDLNANSAVALRGDEAELVKGSGKVGTATGFRLRARTLRIETEGGDAEVRLNGERNVVVTATNTPVRVFSKTGVPVALVAPGMGMSFDPYAAPADDFDMSGCLLQQAGGPIFGLVAENVRFQLTGGSLAAAKGNRVHITGTRSSSAPTLKGASAVVQVSKVEVAGRGGCLAAASAWSEEKMDGKPNTTQITKGKSHTGAIIAGVAVAGAGGGIGAAVCCKSK